MSILGISEAAGKKGEVPGTARFKKSERYQKSFLSTAEKTTQNFPGNCYFLDTNDKVLWIVSG